MEAILGADRHLWLTLAILFGEFALVPLVMLIAVRFLTEMLMGRTHRRRREDDVELRSSKAPIAARPMRCPAAFNGSTGRRQARAACQPGIRRRGNAAVGYRDTILAETEIRVSCDLVSRCGLINVVIITPLVALIAGILILVVPRLLNYIVAIYLIIIGLAGLLPYLGRGNL